MTRAIGRDWPWVLAALAGTALISWLGLVGFAWSDYDNEVAPAMQRFAAGDIAGFLAQAPAYGGSLILRAPFAGIATLLGGGEVAIWRALAIPCLLITAWLGVVIVKRMRVDGRSTGVCALVLALFVVNPITIRALDIGHPEELLGGVLCVAAVLAAARSRSVLAAVLLGLAIATKAWAVLAIGPVLLALPHRRILALVIAGAVSAVVLAPLALFGTHAAIAAGASTGGVIFLPWQLWWFLGESGHVVIGGNGLPKPDGYRVPPGWLSPLTHPLIAFTVVPLSLLWARVRGWAPRLRGEDVLLLLALLFALRCVLDPWNSVYYVLPCIFALLTWEALCRPERPPILALAVSALTWVTFEMAPEWMTPDMQSIFYLAWALPLVAFLVREAYAPSASRAGATPARDAAQVRPVAPPARAI
jgi:hypothetical protein